MIRLLAGLGVLLGSAGWAEAPVKLAAPGLTVVDIDAAHATFYLEHLAAAMASDSLRVVTQKEIASLLGLEREKALLGCTDESGSCMAELGAALGAEGVLLGDLAHIGKRYQFTLKVISARDGAPLALQTGKCESEEALLDALSAAGAALAHDTLVKAGRASGAVSAPPSVAAVGNAKRWWPAPAIAGVALVSAGVAFLFVAENTVRPLNTATVEAPLSLTRAMSLRDDANLQQSIGVACLVAGVAAAVAAGSLWLFGGDGSTQAIAFVTPAGGGLVLSGSFP